MKNLATMALQLALSQLKDENGDAYYGGTIDGAAGPLTQAALGRLAQDWGLIPAKTETVPETNQPQDMPDNAVLVFSLAKDGEKYVSEHFKVKEFACHDGNDVVPIHPKVPEACEKAREINGAFTPGSAYRHPAYNASIGGAKLSRHMYGDAVDIPAVGATPEELYERMDAYVGDQGGLGIYDWGIHVDFRGEKARWDSRTKK